MNTSAQFVFAIVAGAAVGGVAGMLVVGRVLHNEASEERKQTYKDLNRIARELTTPRGTVWLLFKESDAPVPVHETECIKEKKINTKPDAIILGTSQAVDGWRASELRAAIPVVGKMQQKYPDVTYNDFAKVTSKCVFNFTIEKCRKLLESAKCWRVIETL